LCAKWQQNIGYDSEAPISKHQIPNNIQIPISNDRNVFVSEFGPAVAGLEIIWNLGFGYWDFPAKAGFGSGYAGLGLRRWRRT
jgi:hypothetical protein